MRGSGLTEKAKQQLLLVATALAIVMVVGTTGGALVLIDEQLKQSSESAVVAQVRGIVYSFQMVFTVVALCAVAIIVLGFLFYRKRVRDRFIGTRMQLFKALSESLDMAVCLYEPRERIITTIVDKASEVTGGKIRTLVLDEATRDRLALSEEGCRAFARVRAGDIEEALQGEYSFLDKSTGKTRWVFYALSKLVFDGKDQILVVLRDATAEKDLQISMHDAMMAAEAANRAKSAFLSNMSHEIRTPLNAIIGMLQVAIANVDDPVRMKENLEKIGMASDHLLSLINDVLDISKIESGKMVLVSKPFFISDMLDRVESLIRPQCEQKNQRFEIETSFDANEAYMGDRIRLQQLVVNLLSNAVKYTKNGGLVELEVRVKPSPLTAYRRLHIIVRDNGIGMSQEFKEHLFEPFTMEGRSNGQGTGLGMPIAKNIVTMMGGDIFVETELNRGTTFLVVVDVRMAFEPERRSLAPWATAGQAIPSALSLEAYGRVLPDDPVSTEFSSSRCATGATIGVGAGYRLEAVSDRSLAGIRVLMAEDNDLNAEIMGELLKQAGLEVERAENGQAACDQFCASPVGHYDAVLMDVQMPVLDGYQATRFIRALERDDARTVPIIAMSANAFAEDVSASLESGMNDHLSKPIDIKCVISALSRYIAGRPPTGHGEDVEER